MLRYEKHNARAKRCITGYKLNLDLTAYCSFTELASMPRLRQNQREQVIGRLQAGERPRVIANAMNCSVRTIERLRERYNATNSTPNRPRSGRPRITTASQNRHLHRQHFQKRFRTASESARQAIGTNPRHISAETVRRRMRTFNPSCRRPARGPILTYRHRRERLQWTQQRENWHHQQWRTVVYSDESRYCLSVADGRVRVWRKRDERYRDDCIVERDAWGGQSIIVWGGIALNHKLGPVIFQNIGPGRGNGVNASKQH